MDYQKLYDNLIIKARNTSHQGYTEIHHILPRCLGGTDKKENLVKMSAKQHFVAHHLLFKIYRTTKLAHAWNSMCLIGEGQEERRVNSRYFEKARQERKKLLSRELMGENNPFFGKSHTDETRKKISDAHIKSKFWQNRSPEHSAKLLEAQQRPKSEDHKKKIGRKGLIMLQNINTGEVIRISSTDHRVSNGEWVNPKTLNPEPRYKCTHCDVETIKGNLSRWHNDNCKNKFTIKE